MTHRTRVVTTGPATCVGVCSCGWTTTDKRNPDEARVVANKHLVEAMRAQRASDPNQLEFEPEIAKQKQSR